MEEHVKGLDGKVAIVTGGGQGIGRALTLRLAAEGCKVAIFDLSTAAGEETAKLAGAGFEGITVADKSRAADSYAVGEIAGVIRKGTVWVTAGAAVTPADTVYFAAATGVVSNISAGGTAITGAKFETTAASGALVRVYLG